MNIFDSTRGNESRACDAVDLLTMLVIAKKIFGRYVSILFFASDSVI